MQCSCGGSTKSIVHPRQKNNQVIGTLEYDECKGCGRVGNRKMYRIDPQTEIKTLVMEKY